MRHIRWISAILSIILFVLPLSVADPQENNTKFNVEVNVVSLDVEVLDPQGHAITDLHPSDFVLKENGVPVEISNFALLSDLSSVYVLCNACCTAINFCCKTLKFDGELDNLVNASTSSLYTAVDS